MVLEICANSYQSAFSAYQTGSQRIELCSELSVGGITPSYGLIKEVMDTVLIPVFVLIRPRSGHFTYSDTEFTIMKRNIEFCKSIGCAGIVSGVLNKNKSIDLARTKELINITRPLQFTFHRAFDCVKNPQKALEQLCDIGADRILSSGQQTSALKGIEMLKELDKQAKERIIILPGGGIDDKNVQVFKEAGFKEIHASASSKITCNNLLFSEPFTYSDKKKIKAILDAI